MKRSGSLWHETVQRTPRPALGEDVHVDVCVIGAGISGLSAALELTRGGASVAVLEGRFVGAGASGYNTAKLSSLHGLIYSKLERSLGADAARLYGIANECGIERVFELSAHSIRAHETGGRTWLLVGGESHKTGQADAAERYARLAAWARERFAIDPVMRWATQDQMPADGVPYVGPVDPVSRNVYVATGFRKWGLAMGVASAELLAAWVAGRDHPWRELFDTRRLRVKASASTLARENANVGAALRRRPPRQARERGVARAGEGRALSARCTHLGCIVNWNSGEQTWDCPCHGSRFGAHGEVLMGPAIRPLEPRRVDGL